MEPKFNTSFIPKKSLQADVAGTSSGDKYVGRRTTHGPGYYLATLLFLATAVASIGLFGYTKIVENSINDKIKLLEDQKAAFDVQSVDKLIRAETKIKTATNLAMQHIAVSGLFNLLEDITLRNVQYTELQFATTPGQSAGIILSGKARDFQSVGLQAQQFKENANLSNPLITKLEQQQDLFVDFSLNVTADQRLTLFSTLIKNGFFSKNPSSYSIPREETPVVEVASSTEGRIQGDTGSGEAPSKADS